jgi:hypothetical protein
MILIIVAPSFCDYRTEPNVAQYEISERYQYAACPFLFGLKVPPVVLIVLRVAFINLL